MERTHVAQYKKNKQLKQWVEVLNRHLSKEDKWMAKKHMETWSPSLMVREMQFETTMIYNLNLVRITTFRKSTNRSSHCGIAEMKPTIIHEEERLIPGFTQWVEHPALPWVVVKITDTARMPSCCGCGIGQHGLQLWFNPQAGNIPMPQVWPYKKSTNNKCQRGCGEKGSLLHCCPWNITQLWNRMK